MTRPGAGSPGGVRGPARRAVPHEGGTTPNGAGPGPLPRSGPNPARIPAPRAGVRHDRTMRIRRALADLGWRLSPYRLVGRPLPSEPGIFLGAPHTSNWDFVAFLGVAWHYEMPMKVLIKDSWVKGPAGPLITAMGGVGVDRSRPSGLVEDLIHRAARGEHFQLVIAPKGTRSPRDYWRSGFHRIALGSGLPVTLAGIDHGRREVEIGPTLMMSDDVRADMAEIRAFYARFGGVVPARRSEPRLREEDADQPVR